VRERGEQHVDVAHGTPKIYAGGPWSHRNGGGQNHMASFVSLSPYQEATWRKRIAALQAAYTAGIAALDAAAGGDFTTASADEQDSILANDAGDFLTVLFVHAIEGFLAAPEYGGNQDLVGWKEIGFRGDTQPRGYTAAEIGESDGLDPVIPDALVSAVMANFELAARHVKTRGRRGS
jgi:hypothetical protein